MAQTLWQRLTRGREVVEFQYANPVKAKIGCSFTLDVVGHRDMIFNLREILAYTRRINGKEFTFADYVLLARPIGQEDVSVRVRFVPVENPDASQTHTVLLLSKYDEMKFCRDLDNALRDATGELVITEENREDKYWRINDVRDSYRAEVAVIRDVNGDGKVQENEVEKHRIEYWDFHRETTDEAGQKYVQYLFVELDDYKMQTMWRGEEVDAQRISVL